MLVELTISTNLLKVPHLHLLNMFVCHVVKTVKYVPLLLLVLLVNHNLVLTLDMLTIMTVPVLNVLLLVTPVPLILFVLNV